MNLSEIFENKEIEPTHWIVWENGGFVIAQATPKNEQQNRETLARAFIACVVQVQMQAVSQDLASCLVRSLWIEEAEQKRPKTLPRIIGEDGFLRMYALGMPLSVELFDRIWGRIEEPIEEKTIGLEPIHVEWNEKGVHFFDIDATPPGILSKLLARHRLKKDRQLLSDIASDLEKVSTLGDSKKRMGLSLAILSHGAAYREIDGYTLLIPSFTEQGKLIPYTCRQHLIAEGLKTLSLVSVVPGVVPIYLCQGTEFWPSQPSMLGSILANFGEHGSATAAYAHSWRRIHKQLRDLPSPPLVAGHSMGGALAIQIGLYSHDLIEGAYAFNPPVPNERDYLFYHQMSTESKEKIHVIANLDDFAFWRIGSKVIGSVTLYLAKIRWKYYPVGLWDCILLLPAFVKFIRNVRHAFPAHQSIAALYENWVCVKLTQEEVEKENSERTTRFDYLHFLPKLYDPMKSLLRLVRKIFRWGLEGEYLRNEIEIVALHERDLLDTITDENREEILHELDELSRQKRALINRLLKT